MTRRKYEEKREWVLRRLQEKYDYSCRVHSPPQTPWICAIDEEDQRAWQEEFGGQVKIYSMGPNVSPDFARTLRRMCDEGDLRRVVRGNQDARSYNQKTWYIDYTWKNGVMSKTVDLEE